jgi:hypothetical protein
LTENNQKPETWNLKPRTIGGLAGMMLVAGLYVAHARSVQADGTGLSVWWLATLTLPGALAAALATRRGMQSAGEKEGALAGLLTAHFATTLLVVTLVASVLRLDWARYAEQAGPEVAEGVRAAALPATVAIAALTAAICYAGCTLAGWLGAVGYGVVRGLFRTKDERPRTNDQG